jgi:hypothetical protein
MASETIDYNAVLADLEAKKAGIEATIAGIRQMLSAGDQSVIAGKEQSTEVRFDSFFGMSMPDAIIKFLEMAKRPRSVSEITKALEDGGLKSTAKKLMMSVGSTLSRMKAAGDAVSVQGKWGLRRWYPGMREEKVARGDKARKRGRPKGSKADAVKAPKTASAKSTTEQIERINALHAAGKRPGEIGKELGLHHLVVARILREKLKAAKSAA